MIEISETQALQLLACLSNSIYPKDDENSSEIIRKVLIDISEDLMFDLAEKLNIEDWNDVVINPITLKINKI